MPTNRELYFQTLNKKSTYLTENVIRSLLIKINKYKDENEFYLKMDDECLNEKEFNHLVKEVESGRPYQYVINSSSFYGLDFYVDERVLIPRNETEELLLKTIDRIKRMNLSSFNLLDVCTGSGCLAISLAKIFPNAVVYASDISSDALDVARMNNERLKTNVKFYHGNLADPLIKKGERFDVLISNPPYIKAMDTVDPMVLKHEPHLALFAYPNTKYYHEMILSFPYLLKDNALVCFEIEDDMEESLKSIIKTNLPNSRYYFEKDMYGHMRFLFIEYMEKDTEKRLGKPVKILKEGGIVCFPTETVMGLGVIFDNEESYKRLNIIKNRPDDKPYTLMLDDWSNAEKYACIPHLFNELIDKCGDYPMTFLLNKKDTVPNYVTHGTNVIGIRVPNHHQLRMMIKEVGKPLLVPSANKSGDKPALNSEEAKEIFGQEVDYYIEGSAIGGKPSTIIDLTNNEIKIIREGDLTLKDIKERIKI